MQTFLPFEDFALSAEVLHDKHLFNQLNEGYIVLKSCVSPLGGWPNHPVTRMWRGHEGILYDYCMAIYNEVDERVVDGKFKPNTGFDVYCRIRNLVEIFPKIGDVRRRGHPSWLGNREFHLAHRRNLVRKSSHYAEMWPDAEPAPSSLINDTVVLILGRPLTTEWK